VLVSAAAVVEALVVLDWLWPSKKSAVRADGRLQGVYDGQDDES